MLQRLNGQGRATGVEHGVAVRADGAEVVDGIDLLGGRYAHFPPIALAPEHVPDIAKKIRPAAWIQTIPNHFLAGLGQIDLLLVEHSSQRIGFLVVWLVDLHDVAEFLLVSVRGSGDHHA